VSALAELTKCRQFLQKWTMAVAMADIIGTLAGTEPAASVTMTTVFTRETCRVHTIYIIPVLFC
jgi:hypothetical protein